MASIKASPFRLSLIQLGGTGANKQANLAHAKEMVLRAAKAGEGIKNHLVVLPEVFNSPYAVPVFRKYAERIPKIGSINSALTTEKTAEGGESVSMLSAVAKEAGVWLIGGSIPEIDPETDSIYNTCTVYDPSGELVAIHRKVHLFDIDIPGKMTFKESDSLTGGRDITSFETPFGKIGLGICYDIRFPEMAAIAARQGCIALVYPAAFNMTTGPLHWELLQRARAVDNQVFVSMCSPARSSDLSAYQAWGHTSVYDPMGLQLATTDEKESIVHALIDPEVLITARKGIPVTVQRRFDVYKDVSA